MSGVLDETEATLKALECLALSLECSSSHVNNADDALVIAVNEFSRSRGDETDHTLLPNYA